MIPVYEAGEAEGQLFIAMRFVEGIDLANLIARETEFEPERAVRIVAQLASALDAAHARGLVHRDVKPANVLIGAAEHVYLTDFGLTKHAAQDTPDPDRPVRRQRRLRRARADPRRGDGRPHRRLRARLRPLPDRSPSAVPFDRDGDVAKMYAHITEPPPVVTEARPDLPAALDAVVAKAMAKDPQDRYATAGDLAPRPPPPRLLRGLTPQRCVRTKTPAQSRIGLLRGLTPSGGAVGGGGRAAGACWWSGWWPPGWRRLGCSRARRRER